jgi:hypothetical protein
MKNSKDTTGNRTRYLRAGSAMPQQTLAPLTGEKTSIIFLLKFIYSAFRTFQGYAMKH